MFVNLFISTNNYKILVIFFIVLELKILFIKLNNDLVENLNIFKTFYKLTSEGAYHKVKENFVKSLSG